MQHARALLLRLVGTPLGIGIRTALRSGVGIAIGIAIGAWTTPVLAAEPGPEALVAELTEPILVYIADAKQGGTRRAAVEAAGKGLAAGASPHDSDTVLLRHKVGVRVG